MATKYVIRKQDFEYTDEGYLIRDEPENRWLGGFSQVFDDEKKAKETYRNLLLPSLRHPEINRFDGDFMCKFQKIMRDKLADQSYNLYNEPTFPHTILSDDNLFEIAHLTGWLPYVLCTFEEKEPLYAIWLISKQAYLISGSGDDCYFPLVGENGKDLTETTLCENGALYYALKSTAELHIMGTPTLRLMGTPEQLSDQPELLKRFLALPDTGFFYDVYRDFIEFRDDNHLAKVPLLHEYLQTLNSLLKKPLYELHPIRPDQIKQVFENPTVKIA